jgi:hypothetical protein
LTTADGAAAAFSRGLLAAAVLAVLVGSVAFLRMSGTKAAAGAGVHLHH